MEKKYEERAKEEEGGVEGRERRLYEASATGSVNSLKQLMEKDPLTLARAAVTCFNETPLHVAAMLGHLDFANYLLTHKPDMTMAVDLQGRSPLHLASANGYVEMINILLSANPDACLIRDEDGRTPLHLAVMKGQVEVIRVLVGARPQVTRYKLDQGETILHSAVKHNRLGVLKLLVELVGEVQFVNSKDDYGNTVLHTATSFKQFKTTKYLVERPEMEVNAVNGNGFTALDIVQHMPRDLKGMEIRESLVKAGVLSSRNIGHEFMGESGITMVIENPQWVAPPLPPPPAAVATKAKAPTPLGGNGMKTRQDKKKWMEKKRDSLMVAATLIAGMTFQAATNPPGGVWDEEEDVGNGEKMFPGTSKMAHYHRDVYYVFMSFNTACFVASLCVIFLVVSGIPVTKRRILIWPLMIIMWITLIFMALTYSSIIWAISPAGDITTFRLINYSCFVPFTLLLFVALVHILRVLVWCRRKIVPCSWKVGKTIRSR